MRVVCLSVSDTRLLAARFAEHGNSHRRMRDALVEAGATQTVTRLDVLRGLEHQFRIDLGSVCHRFHRRTRTDMHPIERMVVTYIAELRVAPDGEEQLWVLLDRVDEIRELMEGRLVGEPGS